MASTTRPGIVGGIPLGIVATLFMDAAAAIGTKLGFVQILPLGRWIAGFADGRFVHHTILESPPVRGELPLGGAAHYLIGVTLGTIYLLALRRLGRSGGFWSGLIYGVATSAFSLLLMFPAMGFGLAGLAHVPSLFLLRQSLYTHLAFGVGLGLASRWLFRRRTAAS